MDKNNVHDVSQVFILPHDSPAILGVFQESVNVTVTPQGFQSIIFSFRFGRKKTRHSIISCFKVFIS
jgi:hypothetical protein